MSAKFIIPIEHTELITWNKKSTGDDRLEYDCQIKIQEYEFGFSKFKDPGAQERAGSISQFMHNGQVSLWKTTNNGASVIGDNNTQVTNQKPNIINEITDPSTYNVSISGFSIKIKSKSARIEYMKQ